MNYEEKIFYDVESFPTFACVTFLSLEKSVYTQFLFGCGYNDLKKMKEFLDREILLIGFNNHSYDDPAIRFILQSKSGRNLPENLFALSGKLISDIYRNDEAIKRLRYPRFNERDIWKSIDLMKIMAFDRMGVSLKQIAINLKHERIQDLPYPYDYAISSKMEIDTVLDYNKNDVDITKKLYLKILPQIELREDIGRLYGVDVSSASDSKMGNIILEHFYKEELGADVKALRELRTRRTYVNLADCVPDVIQFTSRELQELRDTIISTTLENPFKFEQTLNFRGLQYTIASGGIHSKEASIVYRATEDKKIITCDIASMYPSCIIINNIYPEHLGEDFVKVLKMLTAERLSAKKKNKVKADALKITINGLYGKLNSDTFWLQDAKAMLRVTIAGQLYILMLIEMLSDIGIQCISANTDGIECFVPVEKEEEYYNVCKTWMDKTQFVLEFNEYSVYAKRDVNNYVSISRKQDAWLWEDRHVERKPFGKPKAKGALVPDIDLKKGYKHPIVARAVYEYFVNGTPVENTIKGCNDVLDFCISQKSDKKFITEYVTIDSQVNKEPSSKTEKKKILIAMEWVETYGKNWKKIGTEDISSMTFDSAFTYAWRQYVLTKNIKHVKQLQKTNRFYISNSGGIIRKIDKTNPKRISGLFVGHNVRILNDYNPEKPLKSYDINFDWYIREAKEAIEDVEPSVVQLTLFDFGNTDLGKKSKMAVPMIAQERPSPKVKVKEKDVKEAYKTKSIFKVPATYFIVTKIYRNEKSATLKLYSLSKGTAEHELRVKTELLEKKVINEGSIVLTKGMTKKDKWMKTPVGFEKVDNQFVWWLDAYEVFTPKEFIERNEL